MADDKKESSEAPILWGMIGFIFLVFILVSFFSGGGIPEPEGKRDSNLDPDVPGVSYSYSSTTSPDRSTYKEKVTDLSIIKNKKLGEGVKIINKDIVDVRISPAGSIIGKQFKRATGIIQEGPLENLGSSWVRIDYKEAPDGWVDIEDITTRIALTRSLNIFPILYDFIKPILIGVMIIVALFIVWVRIKFNKLLEREKKKRELVMRKYGLDRESKISTPESGEDSHVPGNAPMNLPTGGDIPIFSKVKEESTIKNERWDKVQKLISSRNSSDWKQAIIDADIILDDMITKMGYEGENLGTKLKNIEESDFLTLNKAWEAHKVRNKIAHAGSDFVMSRNEADRVIGMYKEVFEEFYFI